MTRYHVVYENTKFDLDVIYDNRTKAEAERLVRELKNECKVEMGGQGADKFKMIKAN
jgi:hypothetical protein